MSSSRTMVYHCSVSNGGQILYSHNAKDQAIESLATSCLDKIPPYHKCYFQTIGEKTFGFLIEEGFVYFVIADKGLLNFAILQFLNHVRDEYTKLVPLPSKKGSRKSVSNMSSLLVQEQLVPVILRLITSLEHVSQNNSDLRFGTSSSLSPLPSMESNGEVVGSTKAPLLYKSNTKEKKRNKEHVVGMRGVEIEEHQRPTDGGINSSESTSSLKKDVGYVRTQSINGTNSRRKKWCRLVRIIIAIDIVVCSVLLGVWLLVCGGIKCLR